MLLEFYNGVVVFASCDNLEHLALMERLLGKLPRRMTCKLVPLKTNVASSSF